ncbi:MAG TPA: hypothetical protein VMU85_02495 [Stellaceae bacterium]|nr:hypothetical protein [Stellaceae bacterium]
MPVPCPACRWPTALEERGPAEDPSILLTGTASIGDALLQVVAIRIDPTLRWALDYKRGVAAASYKANALSATLETFLEESESIASELDELLGERRPSIVQLATGPYKVWILPARREFSRP